MDWRSEPIQPLATPANPVLQTKWIDRYIVSPTSDRNELNIKTPEGCRVEMAQKWYSEAAGVSAKLMVGFEMERLVVWS